MTGILLLEQLLNGLGYGLMLFLLAAGLTLVFGIMDVLNLAHGSLFMVGRLRGGRGAHAHRLVRGGHRRSRCWSRWWSALLLEVLLMRRLYTRDHLAQVLATFGVILVADDVVKMIWGPSPVMAPTPAALAGPGRAHATACPIRRTAS